MPRPRHKFTLSPPHPPVRVHHLQLQPTHGTLRQLRALLLALTHAPRLTEAALAVIMAHLHGKHTPAHARTHKLACQKEVWVCICVCMCVCMDRGGGTGCCMGVVMGAVENFVA